MTQPTQTTRWWSSFWFWLVASGPVAVIVAGVATMAIAWHGADPQLHETDSRQPPAKMSDAYGRSAVEQHLSGNEH